MAIKVGGTTVIDDSRNICSVITASATTVCASANICAGGGFYGSGVGLTNLPGVSATVCPTNIVSGTVSLDTANYNYFKVRSNSSVIICGLTSNATPNFFLDVVTTQGATVTTTTQCLVSPYSNFALNNESSKRLIQFTNVCGIFYGRAFSSVSSDQVASYAGNALTYQAFSGNNFAASCSYPIATCIIPTDATLCSVPNASTPYVGQTYNYLGVNAEIFKCCWAWLCCVDNRMLNERFGEAGLATCAIYLICHNNYRKIYYNNSFYLVKSGNIQDINNGCQMPYLMAAKYNPGVTNPTGFQGMHCPCAWISTGVGANTGDQLRDPILTYSVTNDWIAVASGRCNCTLVNVYKLSCFLDRSTCCLLQSIQLACTHNCRDLQTLSTLNHFADICTYPAVLTYTRCSGPCGAANCSTHNTYKFWSSGGCTGCPLCYSGCEWSWAPRAACDAQNSIFRTACSNAFNANYMSLNGQYQWWIWKPCSSNCLEWCLFCDLCYGNCSVTCWVGVCGFSGWSSGDNCTCVCYYKIVDVDLCHMLVFGSTGGSNNGVQSSVCHGGWTRLSNNTVIASLEPKSFKPCTQGICQGWYTSGYEQAAGFAVRFGCDYVTGCMCFFSCSFPPCCQVISCGSGLSCCYGLIYDTANTCWNYGTVGHTANVRSRAANLGITSGISVTMHPSLTNLEYCGCSFDYLGPMSLSADQLLSKC